LQLQKVMEQIINKNMTDDMTRCNKTSVNITRYDEISDDMTGYIKILDDVIKCDEI